MLAVSGGHLDTVECLLQYGANVDAVEWVGNLTPLGMAVASNRADIARILLTFGADINKAGNNNGWTPLCSAVYNGNLTMVKFLLDFGADINKKNTGGSSPIYYAVFSSHLGIVKLLLDNGVNVNEIYSTDRTLLFIHICTRRVETQERLDIIKILLNYGANINHLDDQGKTALDYAKEKNHTGIIKLLQDHLDKMKARLEEYFKESIWINDHDEQLINDLFQLAPKQFLGQANVLVQIWDAETNFLPLELFHVLLIELWECNS